MFIRRRSVPYTHRNAKSKEHRNLNFVIVAMQPRFTYFIKKSIHILVMLLKDRKKHGAVCRTTFCLDEVIMIV